MRSRAGGHGSATASGRERGRGRPRGSTGIAALIFAAILALLGAAPAAATPGWQPPVDISSAGETAHHPLVAVGPAGDVVAVWTGSNGTNPVIRAASKPAGEDWQAPVDISAAGDNASEPRVGIDAEGNATALWIVDTAGSRIVEAASRPAGEGWQPPKNLSAQDAEAYTPELAVGANGGAVAVWRDNSSGQEIQAASKPIEWGWLPPVPLPGGSGAVVLPHVVLTAGGEAAVIWSEYVGPDRIVRGASRDRSGTWRSAENLTTSGSADWMGIAADDEGNAFATWQLIDGTKRVVQTARWSTVAGWKSPVDVSSPDDQAAEPAIAAAGNGDAIVTWTTEDGRGEVLQASRRLNEDWYPPVEVVTSDKPLSEPEIGISSDGDAVAFWLHVDGSDCTVQTAEGPAGEAWRNPISLSEPIDCTMTSPGFDFGLNADDDAIAVWDFRSGPDAAIQAAIHDRTGPELRSVSIPAVGKAGEQLSFSVSPFDALSPPGTTTWSFGDGTSATGNAVVHAYSAAGDYTVTVEATDVPGNASSASGQVTVSADPTPPAPTPPTPTPTADAKAKRQVQVRKGKAILKLRCPKRGACEGVVKLSLKGLREGNKGKGRNGKKKSKTIQIGRKRVDLEPGEKAKVEIKLSRKGKRALRRAPRGRLKAKLSGSAVKSRTVVLKLRRARR